MARESIARRILSGVGAAMGAAFNECGVRAYGNVGAPPNADLRARTDAQWQYYVWSPESGREEQFVGGRNLRYVDVAIDVFYRANGAYDSSLWSSVDAAFQAKIDADETFGVPGVDSIAEDSVVTTSTPRIVEAGREWGIRFRVLY